MPADGKDSVRYEEWFHYAVDDFEAMRTLGERHLRQACMLMQQAAEKALKAFLLARSGDLRRTHDLDDLLDLAARLEPELERHRPVCERVTLYYVHERYPGEHRYLPGPEEFHRNAEAVEALLADLRYRAPHSRRVEGS